MPHSPGIGAIFGIVSENGVAKASGRVGLYDRSNMALVTKTLADSLGGYQFTGLNQNTNDYLVMALDDDGTPAKNALVQDYIQPIPAAMGVTAYSNWELRARRKDAFCLWVPRFQGTALETMGGCMQPQARTIIGGSYLAGQSSITPGAPQFPALKLNTGSLSIPALTSGFLWPVTGSEAASLEFVFDSTFDSQTVLRGFQTTNGGQNYVQMLGISWTAATKTFRVSSGNATAAGGNFFDLTLTAFYRTATFAMPALTPGVHHIVVVCVLASNNLLYVDGTLVTSFSISGTNSLFCPATYFGITYDSAVTISGVGGTFASSVSTPTLGLGVFGPIAAYHSALSATDVLNSYNDLMIGTSPSATGYARDVLNDDPGVLYRLNEGTYGTSSEFLTNLPSATHYGAITFAFPSPVTGGAMMHFGGGAMRAPRGAGGGSPVQRSWEFWVNPDTIAPSATRTLFSGHYQADATQWWWKVQQTTLGALQLVLLVGTGPASETLTFAYVPSVGTARHIVMVLDKTLGFCKLYVNGVFQEQVSTTATFMSEGNLATGNTMAPNVDCVLSIGGWVSAVAVVTEAFIGYLSEIAVYYKALTPDRIASHYASRTLI